MTPNVKTATLFQLSSTALFLSPVVGSAVALAAIAAHLLFIRRDRAELVAVAAFALGGGGCETLFMQLGLVRFAEAGALCPPWVVIFWAALGTLASGPLSPLRERRSLAIVSGLIVAPASFVLSERLGVLTLSQPKPAALIAIAALMSIALPLLFRCTAVGNSALTPRSSP